MFCFRPAIRGEGIGVKPIETQGFYADPLGPAVIVNNYHKFMFHFDITNLEESYNIIENTAANLIQDSNNTFPFLFFELSKLLKNTKDDLSKLLPTQNRNKRGLINGLGSIIKFISGNLDQDDYDKLEEQIKTLQIDHSNEIQHVNKLVSFSNSISQKFYNEMNHLNLNLGIIQDLLSKQEFQLNILEHYQYIIICLKRFAKIVQTLENTITLSFNDMTNVELFSQQDIINIIKHLHVIYPNKAIVHTDPYHIYENLKFTKTQVVMLDKGLVVILSVPTTDGSNYHLYSVTPVPTINNIVLIPSERYYLQGSTSKWSTHSCVKGTTTYVCVHYNIRTTLCNLTKTVNCDFAKVTNDIKLFQLLNNANILFFSTQKEVILQTCENNQASVQLQGPHLVYSNLSCSLSSMEITLEPKPTSCIKNFPLLYIHNEPIVKQQIKFHFSHLDVNKLKLDLTPIVPTRTVWKQLNVFNLSSLILIICVLCYVFRKPISKQIQIIWYRFRPKRVTEDINFELGVEELCNLPQAAATQTGPTDCYAFSGNKVN